MVQITVEEGRPYGVIYYLGSTHARSSWRGLPLLFDTLIPLRSPSTWAFLIQNRKALWRTPSSLVILRIAPLVRAGAASVSNTILVPIPAAHRGTSSVP